MAALLAGCAPEGPSGGPYPSWFRGPGPEEYIGALEYRRSGFDSTGGVAVDSVGTSTWAGWAIDERILILEESFTERDSAGRNERGTRTTFFWGPGDVAALRETRLRPRSSSDDAGNLSPTQPSTAPQASARLDTLTLEVEFEADTVWRASLRINGRETAPDSAIARAVRRAKARRAAISTPPARDST